MISYVLPLAFIAIVYVTMVVLNERYNLFGDRFPSAAAKYAAYAWLGVFMFALAFLVVASSHRIPTAKELARAPFLSMFILHFILIAFLIGWWLLTTRPPITEFLNLRRPYGESILAGFAVGVFGWVFTIAMALMIALILRATGVLPKDMQPSPMIAWMASFPAWKKATIVFSAMTVEEAFFRGWLQKRVGLIVSTLLFAMAHIGLGQPFLLIGVALISLIIGFTFYRTKNLIPGIIAHGVFDAIQLFVIIPIAFKATGLG
ncbi:MAG: CPBP family intramembrane glutamic endopeptidase [Thermoanaerobaculia bacterium]